MASQDTFTITVEQAGQTLAALLRARQPGLSWNQARQHVAARRVRLNGEIIIDPARRVREGDVVEWHTESAPKPRTQAAIVLRHLDEHVVVAEKPSSIPTVRHPAEREWSARRRALAPTLDDLVQEQIVGREGRARKGPPARLRVVHRLDKATSGLVVFARTVAAERVLGKQFHAHTVQRRYLAVVPGYLSPRRIESELVRDRGDGRRGSARVAGQGKTAITHVEVVERLNGHTLLSCRLETGRTHQIRIHLAEASHPVCGDPVYHRLPDGRVLADDSGAPRLALHAAELGFEHPATGEKLHFTMPLPADLVAFIASLRRDQ
jgi:23S rRNA pseudouridine1911/1915/1917 synthase